jgi:hypothetical protein
MNKFGLHMNFLEILQVLANIFILKIHFLCIFLNFLIFWTGRTITKISRGLSASFLRLGTVLVDGGLVPEKPRGSLLNMPCEGVSSIQGCWITNQWLGLDLYCNEMVRHNGRRIRNARPRSSLESLCARLIPHVGRRSNDPRSL